MPLAEILRSTDVTLAVLAGGEGSRMGRPKSLLEIHGQPVLDELLDRFPWPGPTLLVTSPGRERPPGAHRFTAEAVDPVAGRGPLQGVLTALESATTDITVVVTVDMPGVGVEQLHRLLRHLTADPQWLGVMFTQAGESGEQLEPFPSAFRKTARAILQNRLNEGTGSVQGLAKLNGFATAASPQEWAEDVWTNLNRPADLERWENRGRKKESGG